MFILLVTMVLKGGCGAVADGYSRWLLCNEAFSFLTSSSTVHGGLMKLLVCSGSYSTFNVRLLSKLAVAVVHFGIEASGKSPRRCLAMAGLDSYSMVGKEKDLIAIFHLLASSFLYLL